jgi:hypothetical protein
MFAVVAFVALERAFCNEGLSNVVFALADQPLAAARTP